MQMHPVLCATSMRWHEEARVRSRRRARRASTPGTWLLMLRGNDQVNHDKDIKLGPAWMRGYKLGLDAGLTKLLFLQDGYDLSHQVSLNLMASRQKSQSRQHHLCGIDTKKAYFFLPYTRRYFFGSVFFPITTWRCMASKKTRFSWTLGRSGLVSAHFGATSPGWTGTKKPHFERGARTDRNGALADLFFDPQKRSYLRRLPSKRGHFFEADLDE